MKSRFDAISSIKLKDYVKACRAFVEFNEAKMERLALAAIKYYRGNNRERESLRSLQSIESRWYASVRAGEPDYSVYGDPRMVAETWACWRVYSRGYLLSVERLAHLLPPISSVVDLGCGCGHTAAALSLIFPRANVVGTNIPTSFQYGAASRMGLTYGFSMAGEVDSHADLVFASEYFEHHQRPVEHLEEVVSRCSPKAIIVANSFGSTSVGHFPGYADREAVFAPKAIGSVFNSRLRELGYRMVKTGLWNSRPAFWVEQ